jgi:hypothetical protein
VSWSISRLSRDFARTKRFRGVVRSGRTAIVVDDVLLPWQPRGVEIRREAEAVGGVLGHRAAGILSGVGLAGEFIFFPLSGFTPTTFNDPAAAMTFLRSGSVVRAAVLFGAFGIVVTAAHGDVRHSTRRSRLGTLVTLGDARDDAAIVVERLADHQAVLVDVVQAQLPTVSATTHLDHVHDVAHLVFDLDVALHNDVVRQERDQVR